MARPSTFLKRTLAIAGKEWMHLGRDPATLLFAILMPLIMIVLFGYAVSFDADHLRTVVVDDDRSAESREVVAHLFSGSTFVSAGERPTSAEGERALRDGSAALVVVVPRGFGEDLRRGRDGRVQLLVDAADNTTATSVLSYAGRFAANRNDDLARRAGVEPRAAIEARARALFNPAMKSAVFLTPGLIALIMAMMGVLLTAVTVAREWERGSMEQLFATPVTRGEIIAGKLLPYFAIAMLQFLLVLACGAAIFEMPLRGSMPVLFGMATLFLLAMLCQGLFVSSVAKSQMVATQMAALSSMLPSMLLSGFIAPIDNMPRPLQILSNIVPARHFIHALRAILLRGADPSIVAYDALFLACFVVVMLVLAMRAFPRSLA